MKKAPLKGAFVVIRLGFEPKTHSLEGNVLIFNDL